MNHANMKLDSDLAALREALSGANPPADTDLAIAAAIAKARGANLRRRRVPLGVRVRQFLWPALAFGTAASIVAVIAPQGPVVSLPGEGQAVSETLRGVAALEDARSFLPLVPLAEIERANDAWVVPAQLPRVALAQYGMPIDPARAADSVETELLMRRDGAVLAIRFAR